MRPVSKGDAPLNEVGTPKEFRDFQYARGDLIERIGPYCSYCEMRLDSALAVEHVLPKVFDAERYLNWDNFLLGCFSCNSTKGHKNIALSDCFWPDLDNTARAFVYDQDGLVKPHPSLSEEQRTRATTTIKMVGLDKTPINDPKVSDRRWMNRHNAWGVATESLHDLHDNDTPQMRNQIVRTAAARGYWSIWMTVFRDDPDMLQRLIAAFPGTATDCFDDHGLCVARRGGAL